MGALIGRTAILGVVLLLVSGAGCGGSGREKKIVFWDWVGGGRPRLVAVSPNGPPRGEILANPKDGGVDPTWSPTGDSMAFVLDEVLYVIDRAGRTMKLVGPNAEDGDLVWSPDGSRIAYTYSDIYLVRPDGSDRRVLARCEPDACSLPAWSPDGKHLAYHRDARLEVADTDGNKRVVVRCVLAHCDWPEVSAAAWSPDGTSIALADGNRFGCQLSVVRPDGTQRRTILEAIDSPGSCAFDGVSWSPDGKLLALARYDPTSTAIYRISDRTWRLVRLIDGTSQVAWSPDGRHFAYIDDSSDLLWIGQVTGERPTRVGWALGFDWSPDGAALAVLHPLEGRATASTPVVMWVADAATAQHRRIWPVVGSCRCGYPHWQPR